MSWFGAARFLRSEAKRERERRAVLGITDQQLAACKEALKIFDRPTLQSVLAAHAADVLDALADSLEKRGRVEETPGIK